MKWFYLATNTRQGRSSHRLENTLWGSTLCCPLCAGLWDPEGTGQRSSLASRVWRACWDVGRWAIIISVMCPGGDGLPESMTGEVSREGSPDGFPRKPPGAETWQGSRGWWGGAWEELAVESAGLGRNTPDRKGAGMGRAEWSEKPGRNTGRAHAETNRAQ